MKPLHEDQIHNGPFIEACTHIWSDDIGREVKSGVWDYYVGISKEFNKPLVNHTNIPEKAIIFVGMCHILEECFKQLPLHGSYIFVHRTNDRPFTQAMYDAKPNSVKRIYTVDSRVKAEDVYAIPFGNSSINGVDEILQGVCKEPKRPVDKRVFVCYNTNPDTPHRNESIPAMKAKDFTFVFELNYPTIQMKGDEFYRNVRDHEFTMALAGCGADASRQWAAIQLGSIPIVTDCIEMRHFEDMPLVYCPDFSLITNEWLDEKAKEVKGKSTERMRASYWQNHIKNQTL